MKKSNLLLNILLIVTSICIAVLIFEAFCYFYLKIPDYMPPVVYFDPVQKPAKRLRPNMDVQAQGPYREFRYRITTNAQGFRQTYPFTDDARPYSLAVLGDSQSFGVGMNDDETFASLLAKGLNARVLNTACPGYNTIEEFLTYKNRVRPFKPQQVLLFFFAGNDPYENFSNRALYLGDKQPIQKQKSAPLISLPDLKKFLSRHSATYLSLIKLRQSPQINQLLYRLKLLNPAPPSELAIFTKGDVEEASAHWEITEKIIAELRKEVESDGSQLRVVFIPDRFQVDPAYWHQWVVKYQLDPETFDLRLPNQRLAEFCERNGIAFHDPTEILTQMHKANRNVYWKIDNHLNPLGHETIAEFLVGVIQ